MLLVDITDPAPVTTLQVLRQELSAYGKRLAELPFVVVLNKLDIVDAELMDEIISEVRVWAADHSQREVLCISAATGLGIDSFRHVLRALYSVLPELEN